MVCSYNVYHHGIVSHVKITKIPRYHGENKGFKWYWLVKDIYTTKVYESFKTSSEAIFYVEQNGFVLEPD